MGCKLSSVLYSFHDELRGFIGQIFLFSNVSGSWPVTNPDFNESTWDAMEALVNVHKNISQAPVFNIYVSGDIKNSNENVIVVSSIFYLFGG